MNWRNRSTSLLQMPGIATSLAWSNAHTASRRRCLGIRGTREIGVATSQDAADPPLRYPACNLSVEPRRSGTSDCLAAGSCWGLRGPPGGAGAQDGVEDHHQLAHGGGERELLGLTGLEQALVEVANGGVEAARHQGRHVERGADLVPPAPDRPFAAHQ